MPAGLDGAADRGRRRRPRVGDGERRRVRRGRADAPGVGAGAREGPVQDAGQAVDQVAAAEEVGALGADREAAVGARVEDELAAVGLASR